MQEIVNVRIDDRLIHGQVAAVWSLVTKATRIMVVDDLVYRLYQGSGKEQGEDRLCRRSSGYSGTDGKEN